MHASNSIQRTGDAVCNSGACIKQYVTITINSQRSRKKGIVSSLENNYSIWFSAWHILLTYFNNSIKLIWNYNEEEGQSSISMTLSAHSWKNLKIANDKLKQEILLCSRFCHGDWWWSECWYSIGRCSTLWRASWRFWAVLFRNHQNNMDLVKNLFIVPVENVAVCIQDDLAFKQFWGKYVFETNTIYDFRL